MSIFVKYDDDLFAGEFNLSDEETLQQGIAHANAVADRPPEVEYKPGDDECEGGACKI